MKGYYRIKLDGVADNLPSSSKRRTGEQRLMAVEAQLRKDGIAFVEDFDLNNNVIVRYGDGLDLEEQDNV